MVGYSNSYPIYYSIDISVDSNSILLSKQVYKEMNQLSDLNSLKRHRDDRRSD